MTVPSGRDRGVSPVIATVFVVAIAVILASTVGIYMFDVIETATHEPAPQATFSFVQNGNAVTITHKAGETVPADELTVLYGEAQESWSSLSPGGTVSAGSAAQLMVSGETEVQVVWRPEDAESSSIVAQRVIDAPVVATFGGTNERIKSTNEDGSYLGFGDKRLEGAGYTPEGHLRIAPYKQSNDRLQVRDAGNAVISRSSLAATPGTTSFTVVYDGSSLVLSVDGETISTDAFSVEEDAIAIQLKRADDDITTAKVSNLRIDGASIGSPDGMTVETNDEKSILLRDGGFDDGFTLSGTFTFEDSGPVGDEGLIIRVDVA